MGLVLHRVNTLDQLNHLSPGWGAEIDLRSDVSSPGKLHLSHDPWSKGQDFEPWLKIFAQGQRGPLILNTKEDGLESRCLELLNQFGIQNYFFLDTALPTLVKQTHSIKNPNFAVRFSQWEPEAQLEKFVGLAKWVWIDCFDGVLRLPLSEGLLSRFQVCLVSPELQGFPKEKISEFNQRLAGRNYFVCTKFPELWNQF